MEANLQEMKIENRTQKECQKRHKRGQKLINSYQIQPDILEKLCTVNEIAAILGVTPRRIQQLSKVGILKKTGHGKYELIASLQCYLKYLKRLLRRYMSLYKYCIEVYRKGKTNFQNLPLYEDLKPFPDEELLKLFGKRNHERG